MRHNPRSSRADNNDPGRIDMRRSFLKHRLKQLHHVEDTTDIQIQNLSRRPIWRRLERSAPCRACIGDQDIDPVGVLLDCLNQLCNFFPLSDVSGDANGTAKDAGESVQSLDSLVDALFSAGFARCDNDELGSLQEESCRGMESEASRAWKYINSNILCTFLSKS
jgi:hypothetical protein